VFCFGQSYLEAVNKETLKNAFSRYVEQGILLNRKFKTGKVTSEVALDEDYVPRRGENGAILPQGRIWQMVERIGKCRREGKNRRDNATGKQSFHYTQANVFYFNLSIRR
jgi:hypothetical protein